jgi:hypothetical protein
MRSATVKQSSLRRERRPEEPVVVDLTAYENDNSEAETTAASDRVREFYEEHAEEVIARMRKPTTPTNNIAAGIVLQCETNPRLRAEAEHALEVARHAGEARSALDSAIGFYDSPYRI